MNDSVVGAGAGEPTELAGVAAADTELVYAWALDDDTDDGGCGSGWWARRVTVAALAVSLLLLAGAGVVAVVFLRDPAPTVVAAPAPSVAAPPVAEPPGWGLPGQPPPTLKPPPATVTRTRTAPPVTVTATPPEPPELPVRPPLTGPLPDLAGHNDAFLARLVDSGWTIWNPALMAQRGQEACAMMRAGEPRELIVNKMLVVEPLLTRPMAHQFLQIASATYPNCP